ncbi:MAG: hypothetical protein OR994_04465, partial [Candidatus Poseidoniales archaeon]|nr:hypothetical protein [Candidatus Poseidoniales archaeon]
FKKDKELGLKEYKNLNYYLELRNSSKPILYANKDWKKFMEIWDPMGPDHRNKKAEKLQEEAHKLVEGAVNTAQESHDLMIELSEEVDRLRAKANSSQEGVIRSKREADMLHNKYVVSLRSIHSIQDLFKAMNAQEKNLDDDSGSRLEVTDLMSRLMSGDTLSTDELMALQRN